MHKSFFPLILFSTLGIVLSGIWQHSVGILQWQSSGLILGIFPLLPLMFYHWNLNKIRLLTSTEIDSVYYFGFLITIVTLVSTALSIGLSEGKNLSLPWILLQFGIGLVATGYALFARLHLLAKSATSAEVDVVNASEKLVKNVEKVAKDFDNAGFQVQAFVERTEQRLAQYEQETVKRLNTVGAVFDQQLAAAQVVFQEGLSKAVETTLAKSSQSIQSATLNFSTAITSVMAEITRMQSEAEGISFSLASQRISEFSTEMERSIRSITHSVHVSATASSEAVSEMAATFNRTAKLAGDISKKLQALDGVLALVAAIQDATEAIANFSKSTANADTAISSLSNKTAITEIAIHNQVTKPLENFKLSQLFSEFESAFTATSVTFNARFQSLSDHFPGMETVVLSLSEKMTSVGQAVSKMGNSINTTPIELNAAIHNLKVQFDAVSREFEIALPALKGAIASVSDQMRNFDLNRMTTEVPKKEPSNRSSWF